MNMWCVGNNFFNKMNDHLKKLSMIDARISSGGRPESVDRLALALLLLEVQC